MRDDRRIRERAGTDLVQDLARLLVPPLVHAIALELREQPKRVARRCRVEHQDLVRRHQRVAPERGDVPRDPGCDVPAVRRVGQKRAEVAPSALEQRVEDLVIRVDRRALVVPLVVRAAQLVDGNVERRALALDAGDDRLDHERKELRLMADEVEIERHANGPDPVLDHRRGGPEVDHRLPQEAVFTRVRERDRLTLDDGPVERSRSLVEQAAHVKDVGEVRAELEVHTNVDAMVVVVLKPDAFVQTLLDDARTPDVQRLCRDLDPAVDEVWVRQVDVRHVRALRARRKQHGRVLADLHLVPREEPRVPVVQPHPELAAAQVPFRVGVQEHVAFLRRQERQGVIREDEGGVLVVEPGRLVVDLEAGRWLDGAWARGLCGCGHWCGLPEVELRCRRRGGEGCPFSV